MEIQSIYDLFLDSKGISTDSRKVDNEQLFFALSGNNFNGNQFAEKAILQGAKYAIIDDEKYKLNNQYIVVPNTLTCLQNLASFHRKKLSTLIIAVTGTNGKTTTKELISRTLQKKYKVTFTLGNLNNHIGVPLTLLSFSQQTEIGVVEMGANHQNEITQLCDIATPDFGIITNIGKAHLEGFGSFEGVIQAKSELYKYCQENKKEIFINADDELLLNLSNDLERISYGKAKSSDTHAEFLAADPFLSIKWENYIINTQLVGEYNFNNVVAAIAIANYFHVPGKQIVDAISEYIPQNNRSQLKKTGDNTLIIDAYNANPSSMELSIKNFTNIKSDNKLLILGDMFELGDASIEEHQKIMNLVISLNFEKVIFVGRNFYKLKSSKSSGFEFFNSTDEIILFLSQNKISGFTILLKASRGIQLEKILEFL